MLLPLLLSATIASANDQIPGVNYTGFQNFGTQSCNFVSNSSYTCSEITLGQIVNTQIVSFGSQQELCNNLRNQSLNSVTVSWGSMSVAPSVRLNYVNNNCQAFPGHPIFVENQPELRKLKCALTVEAIDGAYGNTGEMQVPVPVNAGRGEIFAHMFKEKSAWQYQVLTSSRSNKYLTIQYIYTKATGDNGDQLTLRATLKNGTSSEITGFAGSEVSLDINNVDSVVNAKISCTVVDADNAGTQKVSSDYLCRSSGTDQVEKSPTAISISDLINNTLIFTSAESFNDVSMKAEGTFALRQGTAVYKATRQGSKNGLMNITGRANLSTPTKFKVRQLSKSVDVSCK